MHGMEIALVIVVGTSPILAAADAWSLPAWAWKGGADRRQRWITLLLLSFLAPPIGPLLVLYYAGVVRPPRHHGTSDDRSR